MALVAVHHFVRELMRYSKVDSIWIPKHVMNLLPPPHSPDAEWFWNQFNQPPTDWIGTGEISYTTFDYNVINVIEGSETSPWRRRYPVYAADNRTSVGTTPEGNKVPDDVNTAFLHRQYVSPYEVYAAQHGTDNLTWHERAPAQGFRPSIPEWRFGVPTVEVGERIPTPMGDREGREFSVNSTVIIKPNDEFGVSTLEQMQKDIQSWMAFKNSDEVNDEVNMGVAVKEYKQRLDWGTKKDLIKQRRVECDFFAGTEGYRLVDDTSHFGKDSMCEHTAKWRKKCRYWIPFDDNRYYDWTYEPPYGEAYVYPTRADNREPIPCTSCKRLQSVWRVGKKDAPDTHVCLMCHPWNECPIHIPLARTLPKVYPPMVGDIEPEYANSKRVPTKKLFGDETPDERGVIGWMPLVMIHGGVKATKVNHEADALFREAEVSATPSAEYWVFGNAHYGSDGSKAQTEVFKAMLVIANHNPTTYNGGGDMHAGMQSNHTTVASMRAEHLGVKR